jgi:hypothetical protein
LDAFFFRHILEAVVVSVHRQFRALNGAGGTGMIVRSSGCVRRHGKYVEGEVRRDKSQTEVRQKL